MREYFYSSDKKKSIFVSDNTINLTPHTFLYDGSMWESESIQYFFNNVPTNKPVNIIDVGAQSGLYSLYAKFLPNATFHSFEPFNDTYKLLQENIALNNITNVITYNIGLSDKKEETILNTSKSHNGLHTIGKNPLRFNDIVPITIQTDTIDNLFYEKNIPVHFIKIDTEGYEYFILKGGEKTIRKYKPYIQLEWNTINMEQCNVNKTVFEEYILDLGYSSQQLTSEELFIIPTH